METNTSAAGSSPAPATPTPETPAAAPAPSVPAVEVSTPSPSATAPSPRDILGALSADERREVVLGTKKLADVLAAKKGQTAPPPAPAADPAQAPAPEPVVPAPAPQTPAAGESEDDGDDLKKMRVTPNDFKEREVIRLMKPKRDPHGNVLERGLTLQEAYAKVYGTPAAATPAAQTPASPTDQPETPADPALTSYDQRITEINAQIKKLSEERAAAREDADLEKADSLSDQLADARAELKILSNERQGYIRNSEQAAIQSFQSQVTASRDRALAQHPELQAEGSLHRLALDAYVQRSLNDPARSNEWSDPNWPERLIGEFTQKHGLKAGGAAPKPASAVAPAAPATPATPTPPSALLRQPPRQVPGAKLVTSADGAQPSVRPALTVDDLRAALPHMTAEQRRGLAVQAMKAAQASR